MIPKITQDAPNIVPRYWCSTCGRSLPAPDQHDDQWRFCPRCGEPIEYEKAEPVQWREQNCEKCGRPLIQLVQDRRPFFRSNYTTDVMLLRNAAPDLQFCRSLEMGVIPMSNDIISRVSAMYDIIGNHPEVMAENTKIVIAVQSTQTDEQTLAQIQRMIDASMERLKDSMKLQVLQEQHGGQTAPTVPNQQDLDDMLDNLTIFDQ